MQAARVVARVVARARERRWQIRTVLQLQMLSVWEQPFGQEPLRVLVPLLAVAHHIKHGCADLVWILTWMPHHFKVPTLMLHHFKVLA